MSSPSRTDSRREEDHVEEQLVRMLESLRVVLPGVQVFLAFLLTVPYSSRFKDAGLAEQILLSATLGFATLSVILFLAPLVGYRLQREEVDAERLRRWNRLVLAGLASLGLTLAGAVPTVTIVVWGSTWAPIAVGALTVLLISGLWLLLPYARR